MSTFITLVLPDGKVENWTAPGVPREVDTIRHDDGTGPRLHWVESVVWNFPKPEKGMPPVSVEVRLTNKRPKDKR